MSKPLLIYFDGRGRAEIIRLVLTACGIEFDELDLKTRDQFLKLCDEGTLLFNQVPYLKIDGVELVQVGAILRFLANRYGMMGKVETETVRIDMLFEGTRDLLSCFMGLGFVFDTSTVLKNAKTKFIPKFFPIYEKELTTSGSEYLVGDKLSLADAGFLEILLLVEEYTGSDTLSEYPLIQKYYDRLMELPNVMNYISKVRKPPSDVEYVTTVDTVLGRESSPKF